VLAKSLLMSQVEAFSRILDIASWSSVQSKVGSFSHEVMQ
jgi:hypothetical protein